MSPSATEVADCCPCRASNDPVMGGESSATFKTMNGVGVFDGEVSLLPGYGIAGFIRATVTATFPDISSCSTLTLSAKSLTSYSGYRSQNP